MQNKLIVAFFRAFRHTRQSLDLYGSLKLCSLEVTHSLTCDYKISTLFHAVHINLGEHTGKNDFLRASKVTQYFLIVLEIEVVIAGRQKVYLRLEQKRLHKSKVN